MGWWLGQDSVELLRARRAALTRVIGEIEAHAAAAPVERCATWQSDAERAYTQRLGELHGLLAAATSQLETAVFAIDRAIAGAGGLLPGQ